MFISRLVALMSSVGIALTTTCGASTQNYPNKPIRIVTVGIGGAVDFTSRVIAQGIAGPLGQQVIVENRGSSVIPGQIVSQAQPDGYTLIVYTNALWIGPFLQKTPYDPVRDFSPVSWTNKQSNILVVNPALPIKSVKELIAYAKARPGELNYTSGGAGGSTHLAAELFNAVAGVKLVRVPYKDNSTEMADLIAGQVQVTFGAAGGVMPHVKSGRLRALAVTSAQPSALFPELPTIAASGLPGYESGTVLGILAPAKTPAAIIDRLNQEVARFLNRTETKEQFASRGMEVVASSPQEFAAKIKSEMDTLGKVIRDNNIRAE